MIFGIVPFFGKIALSHVGHLISPQFVACFVQVAKELLKAWLDMAKHLRQHDAERNRDKERKDGKISLTFADFGYWAIGYDTRCQPFRTSIRMGQKRQTAGKSG